MSPPTYAPSEGNTNAGARGWTMTPKSAACTGGKVWVATTNGAIERGSGSMPSASCIIVTLPHTVIS